jgi:predicted nucleotidyltransferase
MLLDKDISERVAEIIRKYVGGNPEIFLFGSRASKTNTNRSDYDFGIEAEREIPLPTLSRIRGEIEQLPTLHTIEIVDFHRVSDFFKDRALETIEVIR